MANASRDDNYLPIITAGSNADSGDTPIRLLADSTTSRLLVDAVTDIGLAEDTAHSTGDTGVMALGVRQDAQSDFGADGDYVPLSINADGQVRVSASVTVNTEYDEDSAHSSTDKGSFILGVRRDADTTPVSTDGDYHALIFDNAGNLKVNVKSGSAASTQYDEDAAHSTGDTGTLALVVRKDSPANLSGTDGDYEALQVSAGRLWASTLITGDALTALQLIDDAIIADDAAFTPATDKVMMVGFEFDDTTPDSVNEGDAGAARMSSRREVYIQLRDAAGNERGANVNASNQLTVAEANSAAIKTAVELIDNAISGNEMQVDVVAALPAGTNAIGKLAANSGVDIGNVDVTTVIPGTGATQLGKAEDAAHATGDTGVYALGVRDDDPAAHSGADGDYESVHVSAEGAVWGTLTPTTTGGCTIFRSIDLDESEEEVKASAGTVYGWYFHNANASTLYIKFYNLTAANTTVGTSTPVMTLPIPTGASANLGMPYGIKFDTAITVAATTGVADNDTGAPSANDIQVNIFYK